jgi:uncharacterized repeat protein (TIGR02059 family)
MKKYYTLLLFATLLSIFSKAQDYSDYSKCSEQDSLALVAFYWATGGPNWTSNTVENFSTDFLSDDVFTYYTEDYPNAGLDHWLEGPVKDWFGVTLAKRQIGNTTDSIWRVIHLHPTLSRRSAGENNLVGYVPKEVGLLTALEWFKVNGNDGMKNTEVPDELYHSTIQVLDFEGVFFSGVLSNALRNCTNLKYPNFRDNNFESIPLFDFLEEPWVSLWMYRNKIPWADMEPTIEYLVNKGYGYEARDQHDVGEAQEIVVTPGSSVTLTCDEAGENGTYTWYKKGFNTYVTGSSYTINNISAKDTGNYTVAVANEYIRINDGNADYVNTFTKPIHVTFVASTPYIEKAYTDYSGNIVSIEFNKPMATLTASQSSKFIVTQNETPISINSLNRSGRLNNIIELYLDESILKDAPVKVSYTKGTVIDVNGGEVQNFNDKDVSNYVREAVSVVNAITSSDGTKIIIEFDKYMDPASFVPSDFTISGTNAYNVNEIATIGGPIDDEITRKIALITNETMGQNDEIKISYTQGSLTALYGAAVQTFENFAVENIVTENKVPCTLTVVDGTKSIEQVVVFGGMKNKPFELYDDGTNGDEIAEDNIWTIALELTDGDYSWEVYEREIFLTHDTTATWDPNTGDSIYVITPVKNNSDSLISGESNLSLSVSYTAGTVQGDVVYNYRTSKLTIIVDLLNHLNNNPGIVADPYLMGINNDWTNGIAMSQISNTVNKYIFTAEGYAKGEEISYNIKNGDTWENNSAVPRKHTIMDIDTVRIVFGDFATTTSNTFLETTSTNKLKIYPNPVENGELWFNHSNAVEVRIFNLTGQNVLKQKHPITPINIEKLKSGTYLIRLTDEMGNNYQNKFIKN